MNRLNVKWYFPGILSYLPRFRIFCQTEVVFPYLIVANVFLT